MQLKQIKFKKRQIMMKKEFDPLWYGLLGLGMTQS